MRAEIVVVSGLPRSGTSLMMQMLQAGGLEVLVDGQRVPDLDNPRGYCEFERVKNIKEDSSWLVDVRGKAVKIISQLLFDLPATEQYRILFMERNLDEALASQEKTLARLGRAAGLREQTKRGFQLHLAKVHSWLEEQSNMRVLRVDYSVVTHAPEQQATQINAFLARRLDVAAMAAAVEPSLYRNRANPAST
jgi:hypothetical protein